MWPGSSNSSPASKPESSSSAEYSYIQAAIQRHQLLRDKTTGFTSTEHQLIRDGEYAFRKLLGTYRGLVLRLVGTYQAKGCSHNLDLEQEASLGFFNAVLSYDCSKGAGLGTWAYYQIRARLQALTGLQNKQEVVTAKLRQSEAAVMEVQPLLEQGIRSQLASLLHRLTQKQQRVASLCLEGWSWTQIALKLQSTPDAVRMLWARAVERLRLLLGEGQVGENQPQSLEVQPIATTPNCGEPLLKRLFEGVCQKLVNIRPLLTSVVNTRLLNPSTPATPHCAPARIISTQLKMQPWRLRFAVSDCTGIRGSPLAALMSAG